MILPKTLWQFQLTQRRNHIINKSIGSFVRPWSITKHALEKGIDNQGCHKISLCLWEGFGLQTTSFGVFRSETRVIVSLGGASSYNLEGLSCFKEFLNHGLIRVWKNSQTLWQHTKNDHKERRNVG
jgi:hypothetical protein